MISVTTLKLSFILILSGDVLFIYTNFTIQTILVIVETFVRNEGGRITIMFGFKYEATKRFKSNKTSMNNKNAFNSLI